MTVYPLLIKIGGFTITGYGIMMMVAFLLAGWLYSLELKRTSRDPGLAWDAVVAAVVGGIVGAKIYYALLVGDVAALFSRGGLVWYGGFLGGVIGVSLLLWWKKQAIWPQADLVAPALAAGYAAGRVGCFLVGDDYGVPSDVPWAMKFPQGSPPTTARVLQNEFGVDIPAGTPPDAVLAVHPTQIYEVLIAAAIFALLWRARKHGHRPGWLFGIFLALMGMERIFVEIFRAKDDRFFGPFTLAQTISLVMIAVGAWLFAGRRQNPESLVEASNGK